MSTDLGSGPFKLIGGNLANSKIKARGNGLMLKVEQIIVH